MFAHRGRVDRGAAGGWGTEETVARYCGEERSGEGLVLSAEEEEDVEEEDAAARAAPLAAISRSS